MTSYPSPFSREVWHYREANTNLTRRAISIFNWEKAFWNINVTKKVSTFNKIILNYIPHETLTCKNNEKDYDKDNDLNLQ